jgi:hypothetical protein
MLLMMEMDTEPPRERFASVMDSTGLEKVE